MVEIEYVIYKLLLVNNHLKLRLIIFSLLQNEPLISMERDFCSTKPTCFYDNKKKEKLEREKAFKIFKVLN